MNTKSRAGINGQSNSASGNFLVQGSILAAAGIIVRLIGLFYKIPMTRILGDEGIGYYNISYDIYNIGLILSSYSLPLAISKLIAARRIRNRYQDSQRVFLCGLLFGFVVGTVMTLILLFSSDWITTFLYHSPASALPLKVMAPTILVFSMMGVIRGYFQGYGSMIPTSLSQIVEQVVNAVVSIAASYLLMNRYAASAAQASYGAAGGTLGTLCGAVASLILLCILMIRNRSSQTIPNSQPQNISVESWKLIFGALLMTLTPIILSQFVYQLSGSIDSAMFGFIMENKGYTEKERISMIGIYSGKYRMLSNVPVAIATSLGTSMIPSIVSSRQQRRNTEVKNKIRMTVKFNMLIAIPCAVGMGALATPIMQLIFPGSTPLAGKLMQIGAPAVVFFSLSTVTNSVLQGIDLMRKSVTHSAISLAIHIVLVYVMLQYLNWGVYGLVIGNVMFALVVCVLNWIAIGRYLNYQQEVKTTFLLPLAAAAVMGVVTVMAYYGIHAIVASNKLALLVSVPLAVVVYGILIVVLKAVTEEELLDMPFGGRLVRVGKRLHLM